VDLLDRGVVRPVVATSFPFEEAAAAHRYVQDRQNVGKVVLIP
jgi:synaptic vesicle membrane protein VAT-1